MEVWDAQMAGSTRRLEQILGLFSSLDDGENGIILFSKHIIERITVLFSLNTHIESK